MDKATPESPQYNVALAYKSSRSLRAIVALTLLYAGLHFIGSTLVPPVYTVSTEQVLPANIKDSWDVLTDFSAYPLWNPYLPRIVGDFLVGENITLTVIATSSPEPRESHARIAEIAPFKQFSWQGRFPIPGISHTRHVFALERIDDNHTRLLHFEEFRGLAVALMTSGRKGETESNQQAFSLMNQALRRRLEMSSGML